MLNQIRSMLILSIFSVVFFSCEKPEGIGGAASIEGQIMVNVYDNNFRVLQTSVPAIDEDVYIIYGNDKLDFEDTRTNHEGKFKFNFLTKGDYSIYVLSNHSTDLTDSVIIVDVAIANNKDHINVQPITIKKTMDVDDGKATLSGQVFYLKEEFGLITDTIAAIEKEVYLYYEDDEFYSERIRSQANGNFAFGNLIKGTYKVAILGDNPIGGQPKLSYEKTVDVEELTETRNVGNFYLYKN